MSTRVSLEFDDATLADYGVLAARAGRSLEAELATVIERHRPVVVKHVEELGRLSRRLRAMALPEGPDGSDSTLLIRWDRDTDHGRSVDDGWDRDGRRNDARH